MRCSPSPTAPRAPCRARSAYAGRDPFLVLNSDNLYPAPVLRALVELDGPGLPAYERDSSSTTAAFRRIG